MNLYLKVKAEGVFEHIRELTNYISRRKVIKYDYDDNITSFEQLREKYCYSGGVVYIKQSTEAGEVFCGSHHLNDLIRVVHDFTHVKYGFSFSVVGELNTARCMYLELDHYISKNLNDLIFIDTVSQIYYYDKYKKYVSDQDAFLHDICHRITAGSLEEMKRQIEEVVNND